MATSTSWYLASGSSPCSATRPVSRPAPHPHRRRRERLSVPRWSCLDRAAARARRWWREGRTTQQRAAELNRTAELSFPAQVVLAREVEAAGLDGAEAAQAVRAVLFLVGGFILLEDNFAHREPGSRTTQELWRSLDDPTITPDLRAAMSKPTNTDALF